MSGLTVRYYERREIDLPVEFIVSDEHRDQVRFSSGSATKGPHSVLATTIDISSGGLGIRTRQFIPRMCEGSLRILDPRPVGTRSDGTAIHQVAFEHYVKVRRVSMTSHEPAYFVGVSFIDPEPDLEARIAKLLDFVETRLSESGGLPQGADAGTPGGSASSSSSSSSSGGGSASSSGGGGGGVGKGGGAGRDA